MRLRWGSREESRDTAPLMALWKRVFRDDAALIGAFFATLYDPGYTVLAEEAGQLLGCGYLLRDIRLCRGGETVPALYLYALEVEQSHRGRGLGRAMTTLCRERAERLGAALCLMPGDEGLGRWYGEQGFSVLSTLRRESLIPRDEAGELALEPLRPEVYVREREALLGTQPHAVLPETFFRFQEAICHLSGGGLVGLRRGDALAGLACAEREGERLLVKELLFSGDTKAAAAALCARFGGERCIITRPGRDCPGVMGPGEGYVPGLWWGPVFD